MKLTDFDLERALNLLPQKVQDIMVLHDVVVAGGFLRCVVNKERVKDIDIFSTSGDVALKAFNELFDWADTEKKLKRISTKNALSIKNVDGYFVQFITRWTYPDPESLLNSFDFTIARAAIWYDKKTGRWDSLVGENFYQDVAAKRLNFMSPDRQEDPAGSLLRVIKFVKKGYNIPAKSLAAVCARVARDAQDREIKAIKNPYEILACGYGPEVQEERWTRIIHSSISAVTGES